MLRIEPQERLHLLHATSKRPFGAAERTEAALALALAALHTPPRGANGAGRAFLQGRSDGQESRLNVAPSAAFNTQAPCSPRADAPRAVAFLEEEHIDYFLEFADVKARKHVLNKGFGLLPIDDKLATIQVRSERCPRPLRPVTTSPHPGVTLPPASENRLRPPPRCGSRGRS